MKEDRWYEMKTSIDHLPQKKQGELTRVVDILHAEFDDALAESSADWKKSGRILKIILFGSYARRFDFSWFIPELIWFPVI